jgi:hypothetical protein
MVNDCELPETVACSLLCDSIIRCLNKLEINKGTYGYPLYGDVSSRSRILTLHCITRVDLESGFVCYPVDFILDLSSRFY